MQHAFITVLSPSERAHSGIWRCNVREGKSKNHLQYVESLKLKVNLIEVQVAYTMNVN